MLRAGSLGTRLYYLEEDCDAPIFIQAYTAKYGRKPELKEQYSHATFIRGLPMLPRGSRFDRNMEALRCG